MTELELAIYGDPALRRKAAPVEKVDEAWRETARHMLDVMYRENGIGLAAEQVGLAYALCVLDVPPETDAADKSSAPPVRMPLILFNPRITGAADTEESREEGCLSFPDIWAPVSRPEWVEVHYLDEQGNPCDLKAEGLLARALQHEIDHLNGIVFVDRVSPVKRISIAGRLKRLRRQTREKLVSR